VPGDLLAFNQGELPFIGLPGIAAQSSEVSRFVENALGLNHFDLLSGLHRRMGVLRMQMQGRNVTIRNRGIWMAHFFEEDTTAPALEAQDSAMA
jgi:hypothetical protein